MKQTKITEITAKLAFTAVIADVFYIICRMAKPAETIGDMRFLNAVPEMLELMLLTTVIIAGVLLICAKIGRDDF